MVGTANLLAGCIAKYQATGTKTEVIHVVSTAVLAGGNWKPTFYSLA